MVQRTAHLYEFFTVDYKILNGRSQQQVMEAATGALSGQVGDEQKKRSLLYSIR
jgi:hypothetical protein